MNLCLKPFLVFFLFSEILIGYIHQVQIEAGKLSPRLFQDCDELDCDRIPLSLMHYQLLIYPVLIIVNNVHEASCIVFRSTEPVSKTVASNVIAYAVLGIIPADSKTT